MTCNGDCFSCTRPASKCHGGDKTKTANLFRGANRLVDGKGTTFRQSSKISGKKPARIKGVDF